MKRHGRFTCVPKETLLSDNKADFTRCRLDSGVQFRLPSVRSRDFHFTVSEAWSHPSCGALEAKVSLCSCPALCLDKRRGILCRSLSCFASVSHLYGGKEKCFTFHMKLEFCRKFSADSRGGRRSLSDLKSPADNSAFIPADHHISPVFLHYVWNRNVFLFCFIKQP